MQWALIYVGKIFRPQHELHTHTDAL